VLESADHRTHNLRAVHPHQFVGGGFVLGKVFNAVMDHQMKELRRNINGKINRNGLSVNLEQMA
jgi:hypothetical protein